jgi:phosphoribosylamine--glycine ligase/phosphoribosylformylglycinamidine cyclo-ligase
LFTGIMVTKAGPKVLEYNVRFGDPECQTLLPLLSVETDLAEIMLACTDSALDNIATIIPSGKDKFAATVVAAAGGYPGPYPRGDSISLDRFPDSLEKQRNKSSACETMVSSDNIIFHAGTSLSEDSLKTSGGRVIAATSTAATLEAAISAAYALMSTIHFPNMHYRTDIGHRALQSEQPSPSSVSLPNSQPLSYADAGVSVSSGNELVNRIKPLVASTARPGAAADIGGFGGELDLSDAGFKEPPTIIAATDGVGTKLKVAHAINKHDTIGIDLVAMNVNDLIVQGAEPLTFLDVFSCGKLDVDVAEQVVKGIAVGCIEAGCALVGGETAEMPGLFATDGGIYDVSGTAIGAVVKGKRILPDKQAMRVGDMLLGLSSSGCHSNGFSLIRKIVQERAALSMTDPAPWSDGESVGESLLIPTRIYVKPVLRAVQKDLIKGMAHITGGGLLENVPRMLPKHLAASLDAATWQVPNVLRWLKEAAGK